MNSYKYSCPYCGQHVEYSDGYCGLQMACPLCQQRITFPAIPPGALTSSLRITRPTQEKPAIKWSFKPRQIIAALRQFEHWNVVGQCLIPFLILGGALTAASMLRSKPQDQTVSIPAPAVDPSTWEKMTRLARTEQEVQERLRWVNSAYAGCLAADQYRAALQKQYGARINAETAKNAEQRSANAAKVLEDARQSFETAMSTYQNLGGKVDYRQQLLR